MTNSQPCVSFGTVRLFIVIFLESQENTPFCLFLQWENTLKITVQSPKYPSFNFFGIIIFRPHILQIGEENHDLCCVFFPKFAKIPLASIHLHTSDEQV